ncbi:WAT1-related protein At1g68170-like [Neltuma alba]|uniref:WAT1-related protein At1g68170-like n=1 Tax=Neltuma alba TaxID=207710 RepID=UPI0010A525B0|nr:WAT1-related protein At1g68170-like [Prosopis alba]
MILSCRHSPLVLTGSVDAEKKKVKSPMMMILVFSLSSPPSLVPPSRSASSETQALITITYASWLIIHAKMSKTYPCYYSSTAPMSFMAAILSTAFAFAFESDLNQWKFGWDVRLLTVAYAGIIVSGIMAVVMAWCVDMKGPLYLNAFNPLLLVFVALAGSFMLDEKLYLGSIIGGLLTVCGLYMVLWGKGKEMKNMKQLIPSQSSLPEIIVRSPTRDKISPHSNNPEVELVTDCANSKIHRKLQVKEYNAI